ncbi:MAG: trypsin-like peptidase domain-containing protein [Bacteroidetes bacterium]|nr:trypsin-like peptidase domain-containing protein [Bacteroidota bacterium]
MSKRAILIAILLVSLGIVSGAVLVSGIGSSGLFADARITFNTEAPVDPSASVLELNQAFSDVAQRVNPQVVYIEVQSEDRRTRESPHPFFNLPQREGEPNIRRGSGSGVILSDDGYILTNRHVIEHAIEEGIMVTLFDNREFTARLVGEDQYTDIAVIKIDASNLAAASLGNSDEVRVGEWVMAVGNPFGLTSTVTAGIVSAISRNIGILRARGGLGIENFIQTDAAVNPGNSGGALVNLNGQVVGINTAIASNWSGTFVGYSFAVPINMARTVAQSLIRHGKYERGFIGINISDIDAKKADALGMDVFKGVLVESVLDDGAGKAAGIVEGDAIVAVDGKPVETANQLQARVGMRHPGETVELKIWRGGKYITKSVVLKGRDSDEDEDADTTVRIEKEKVDPNEPVTLEKSGLTVTPLTDEIRERYDIDNGVWIENVRRNSPAFEARLARGLVIFEAIRKGERVEINSVSDFNEFASSLDDGESVLLRAKDQAKNTAFFPLKAPLH